MRERKVLLPSPCDVHLEGVSMWVHIVFDAIERAAAIHAICRAKLCSGSGGIGAVHP